MSIGLISITTGSILVSGVQLEYQFEQLDSYFAQELFGVEFDYNREIQHDQALFLETDLLRQIPIQEGSDPDPQENNSIGLIGHEAYGIKSAVFALGNIARKQEIPPSVFVKWQTIVPFVKFLHQFSRFSGETVILGHDFLGIALKVDGNGFKTDHYQLGYANIPIDFLEFLLENSTITKMNVQGQTKLKVAGEPYSFPLKAKTSYKIQEKMNELHIDITYSNLTYLFQTHSINSESIIEMDIADHFIIAQFDSVVFSLIFRKYDNHGITGIETIIEISIGNLINLIINEELPQDQTWDWSSEYVITGNYKGFIPIEETFSWYHGLDIIKRLELFSSVSFSVLTAQNLGVLNDTTANDNLRLVIDDHNRTKEELWQDDLAIKNDFSIYSGIEKLFSAPVKGRDFAILENEFSTTTDLIPLEIETIALNQHIGLANNFLFIQENSIIRELVAECIQRYSINQSFSHLTTNQLFNVAGLELSAAYYIQDSRVKGWSGFPFKLNLIQFATKKASTFEETKKTGIIEIPLLPGIVALLIMTVVLKRKKP
ncbi:MAG: hypothetical protein ACFE9L_14035 [Candidatus Hodarchaeota archaeon]